MHVMRFIFEQIRVGGDRNFAYLIGDRLARSAVIIDPSFDPAAVVARADAQKVDVRYVVNTHSHADHTNGNEEALRLTGAELAAFRGSPVQPSRALEDGECLEIGELAIRCLHTPGHCEDHLVLYVPEYQVAITGDLLFVGKVGGTSTDDDAKTEFESLRRVLRDVPAPTTIWPGHDYGARPSSTIALERATNPFLLAESLVEFLGLKRSWRSFKEGMGLR